VNRSLSTKTDTGGLFQCCFVGNLLSQWERCRQHSPWSCVSKVITDHLQDSLSSQNVLHEKVHVAKLGCICTMCVCDSNKPACCGQCLMLDSLILDNLVNGIVAILLVCHPVRYFSLAFLYKVFTRTRRGRGIAPGSNLAVLK